MSKARVVSQAVRFEESASETVEVPIFLNPADLPVDAQLGGFEMVNVPPTPLIRNAQITGAFYHISSDRLSLPQGMRFNVDML